MDYLHGHGRLYTEIPGIYIMIIGHTNSWIKTTEVISHETLHLTFKILDRAGIELCECSEESFTYLQGNLLGKILSEVYK